MSVPPVLEPSILNEWNILIVPSRTALIDSVVESSILGYGVDVPEDEKDNIAQRVRSIREERGMTQAAIAEEMSKMGFAWRPQTVVKVEAGDRGLKFEEGMALSKVLSTDPSMLAGLTGSLSRAGLQVQDLTRATHVTMTEAAHCVDQMMRTVPMVNGASDDLIRNLRQLMNLKAEAERLASEQGSRLDRVEKIISDNVGDVPDHVARAARQSAAMAESNIRQAFEAYEAWRLRWDTALGGTGRELLDLAARQKNG
ncbi:MULTISPECIES: helix-turn-helix domain-containing protein [unclassified Aeromicrobium]|uniref:helix-turn-helix transcriptional regulator n=1 Tax=unclassified Aeromicrobium TaxID=2633570 RepID=UPI00396B0FA8